MRRDLQNTYIKNLIPGLLKYHDDLVRLNASAIKTEIGAVTDEDIVMLLVDEYLSGGFAGKDCCITSPADVQGLQTCAIVKAFEQTPADAGAYVALMSPAEVYNTMQTGCPNAEIPGHPLLSASESTSRSPA